MNKVILPCVYYFTGIMPEKEKIILLNEKNFTHTLLFLYFIILLCKAYYRG